MKIRAILEAEEDLNSIYEYIDYIEDQFEDIVDEFKEHKTDSDSRPAGPDTSKFRASRSGMIEVDHKVQVHGGQYGVNQFFPIAIKVGGKVDSDVHKNIKAKVKDLWEDILKNAEEHEVDKNVIKTKQGRLSFGFSSGTNWSAYGVTLYVPRR